MRMKIMVRVLMVVLAKMGKEDHMIQIKLKLGNLDKK